MAVGAQNLFYEDHGAYTGEVSAAMLCDLGVKYVIVGHSERRALFGETDEIVNKKVLAALEAGLNPIICVGESLAQREMGVTMELIALQVKSALAGVSAEQMRRCVIAYEPVWAIGTGKVAGPDEVLATHAVVRRLLCERLGEPGNRIPILYGGSVKPANAGNLIGLDNVDGLLIGGASLDAQSFVQIIRA